MKIPALILKQLYSFGSLKNRVDGISFELKNRLSDARVVAFRSVRVNGRELSLDAVELRVQGASLKPAQISGDSPIEFPLRQTVELCCLGHGPLDDGRHELHVTFGTDNFGELELKVKDTVAKPDDRVRVPYSKDDNYAEAVIRERQRFVGEYSGTRPEHITHFSLDPRTTQGNIEGFTGVAQVPLGFAGPLKVNGEHAQGEFLVPLATTEGTLLASYSRGMKVLNLSGGVTCTVVDDKMQRAPVFIFESARGARDFRRWVNDHLDEIRREAEATSSVAKLVDIDIYMAAKFAYLRFNFETGDAAGQNMVGRATFAACSWILEQVDTIERFFLESNLATDKKASHVNVMRTRGKRVIAEATVPREVLVQHMRVEPEKLAYHAQVANVGAILSGANNNGLHSANSITAMFIATGQDVANVAESSAGIMYVELTEQGDLYLSLTIPSLIVATYGGGTGLATQRECLEIMGCYGKGKVRKFAEIIAGVALAGEISLAAAISSFDWVSSHEQYGRNR
ncbi:MAG: hydroxymethylglutaryl-CoA reductase [Acidobacteriota bacterium]|nr:hydroxymethylglutaryl-CoA reductase [Acidobacteriota bacterium]MDH3524524.1 hydroxymethylglutaryl-CoA reductase [Acidobacteriota bacterium]